MRQVRQPAFVHLSGFGNVIVPSPPPVTSVAGPQEGQGPGTGRRPGYPRRGQRRAFSGFDRSGPIRPGSDQSFSNVGQAGSMRAGVVTSISSGNQFRHDGKVGRVDDVMQKCSYVNDIMLFQNFGNQVEEARMPVTVPGRAGSEPNARSEVTIGAVSSWRASGSHSACCGQQKRVGRPKKEEWGISGL